MLAGQCFEACGCCAGAVVTGDVPDYAIVAGVPAKLLRSRKGPQQRT